jgi:hypothetical protein
VNEGARRTWRPPTALRSGCAIDTWGRRPWSRRPRAFTTVVRSFEPEANAFAQGAMFEHARSAHKCAARSALLVGGKREVPGAACYRRAMFTEAYDSRRHALVVLYSGRKNTEQDYAEAARSIERAAADAAGVNAIAKLVIVIDGEVGNPDAKQRKRFADAENQFKSLRFALVSDSKIVHGIFTVIQWLTRNDANVRRSIHSDVPSALRWMQSELGEPVKYLEDLLATARKTAR